jgi:2-keto-4-pentenoate hydratase/2-oxohepta-3-ene-1,7-dioic acid hydratase in catechol pathway
MKITKYVRYLTADGVFYGILEGQTIRELTGDIFIGAEPSGKTVNAADVKIIAPCDPMKIAAVGRNYKSHIADRNLEPAAFPGLFWKPNSCVVGPGEEIVLPEGANNTHYEAELVVVMGKPARHVTPAEAPKYIFGITAGNDISERDWQKNDLQWFRAKGCDTFGPVGPCIVQGLDYNDLLVESRVNSEVRQSQRTKDLIFNVDTIVSYISQFVTLLPGDLIFTGTPGTTKPMRPGDVVEIEIEGVGILLNRVAKAATTMD